MNVVGIGRTIKMISPLRVVFLARDIKQEIGRECEELLPDQHEQRIDRGIAEVFLVINRMLALLGDAEGGASLWDIPAVTQEQGHAVHDKPVLTPRPSP